MKSRKLLFTTILGLLGITSLTIFSSWDNASAGVMGAAAGTTGCGGSGCHGTNPSSSTQIGFSGIPTNGYAPGTTYNVILTITNSTKSVAGFDLIFSDGTISGNPTNTMIMGGKELHHTAKLTASSGVTSVAFKWTAPTTNLTTLSVVGNACNNNGSESNDAWNTAGFSFNKESVGIKNTVGNKVAVYPNPTTNNINFTANQKVEKVFAYSFNGQATQLNFNANTSNDYTIYSNQLNTGNYLLLIQGEKENFHSVFTKQ